MAGQPILSRYLTKKEVRMLLTIAAILAVLWLLGLIGHIGGGLIHLLLVVALVLFIWNMITGRRTTV